jgi:hypothetical protein
LVSHPSSVGPLIGSAFIDHVSNLFSFISFFRVADFAYTPTGHLGTSTAPSLSSFLC